MIYQYPVLYPFNSEVATPHGPMKLAVTRDDLVRIANDFDGRSQPIEILIGPDKFDVVDGSRVRTFSVFAECLIADFVDISPLLARSIVTQEILAVSSSYSGWSLKADGFYHPVGINGLAFRTKKVVNPALMPARVEMPTRVTETTVERDPVSGDIVRATAIESTLENS